MIKIKNFEIVGWEHAIRGMRNPMNSWEKSDSRHCIDSCDDCSNFSICNNNHDSYFKRFWEEDPAGTNFAIGPNDHELMMNLADAGPVHGKFRRMITVYVDITAPLYWWKEFDTYKVGTVANSCSTMHKIHAKKFELDDFSHDHLVNQVRTGGSYALPQSCLNMVISQLNACREAYLETKDKTYWWQMIQLLPSSYNQKRTVMLNYEVLANIYKYRKDHKLDEWREFCEWIKKLPYSEIITGDLGERIDIITEG